MRPSSAAPHAKWNPRSNTPASQQTSSATRHRSTSSASAAAAALATPINPNFNQGSEPPLPPIPAEVSTPDSTATSGNVTWRQAIQKEIVQRYQSRLRELDVEFQNSLRATLVSGGLNRSTVSHSSRRRDSSSSGSSGWSSEGRMSDEQKLRASYERSANILEREMQDEIRAEIRREEARRKGEMPPPALPQHRSAPIAVSKSKDRGILVEMDDGEIIGETEGEDWLWRPGESASGDRDEKWKDAVRQEQQVIWDTIKREGSSATAAAQHQGLSTSGSRKVHFAGSSSASNNSASTPTLPRTPYSSSGGYPTSLGLGHARSSSAHPYPSHVSTSVSRSMSPAVVSPSVSVRPGSARPASPATATSPTSGSGSGYTRWIPTSASQLSNSVSTSGTNGSNPIAIPGSRDRERDKEREREKAADRASGSWRDWGTPSPSSYGHHGHQVYYPHGKMPSNGNFQVATGVRTPSNGNLAGTASAALSSGVDATNSNTTIGQGMRRAVTPGVSSASGYANARQRTLSSRERAPSTPPVLGQYSSTSTRDREKREERVKERERDRGRGHTKSLSKANVVDDRDLDDTSPTSNQPIVAPQRPPSAPHYMQSSYSTSRIRSSTMSSHKAYPSNPQVQAVSMQKRTSSSRSALVDEDAPPTAEAIIMERHSSSRSTSQQAPPSPAPIPASLKGKGKAPPAPVSNAEYTYGGKKGMYTAQLEDFATMLKRELRISAEA